MEQSASPPFSQAARSFFVVMAEAYNQSCVSPMRTAHITKRCFSFAKICEMRGLDCLISLKNPAAVATNHVKHLAITV
jgi:hypothetical protein